jgi:hypothetical protein
MVDLAELEELESRIAALERSMARREAERRLLEASRRLATQQADGGSSEQDTGGSSRSSIGDPVFEAAVRDVVDRVRDEQASEREERWTERRRQASSEWSAALAQQLGLTADQKSRLTQLALAYYEQIRELWRDDSDAGTAPMTFSQRRERVQNLRAEYEQKMGDVLDRSQMEAYGELEPDQKLGAFSGRRGRRGRD